MPLSEDALKSAWVLRCHLSVVSATAVSLLSSLLAGRVRGRSVEDG